MTCTNISCGFEDSNQQPSRPPLISEALMCGLFACQYQLTDVRARHSFQFPPCPFRMRDWSLMLSRILLRLRVCPLFCQSRQTMGAGQGPEQPDGCGDIRRRPRSTSPSILLSEGWGLTSEPGGSASQSVVQWVGPVQVWVAAAHPTASPFPFCHPRQPPK